MIKKLWPGVSCEDYNKWFPLTGKIIVVPEAYNEIWSDVNEWFETFALRAQNDVNAYLKDILRKFDFTTIADARVRETLIDMVFLIIEHWVYNRIPIEFNGDASVAYNNGQTQINSFAMPTINIEDLHPSRMKIWANFTGLKELLTTYEEEGLIDANLIDLDQYYSKTQTDEAIAAAIAEIDLSAYETKTDHNSDIAELKQKTIPEAITTNNWLDLTTTNKTIVGAINELDQTKTDFTYVDNQDISTRNIAVNISKTYTDNQDSKLQTQIDSKQNTLVSGSNIKTINNLSILGSGNITISGGSSSITLIDLTSQVVWENGSLSLTLPNTLFIQDLINTNYRINLKWRENNDLLFTTFTYSLFLSDLKDIFSIGGTFFIPLYLQSSNGIPWTITLKLEIMTQSKQVTFSTSVNQGINLPTLNGAISDINSSGYSIILEELK